MDYYSPVAAHPAGMYFHPGALPQAPHPLEYMYFPVQVYDDSDYVELELPEVTAECVSFPHNTCACSKCQYSTLLLTYCEQF